MASGWYDLQQAMADVERARQSRASGVGFFDIDAAIDVAQRRPLVAADVFGADREAAERRVPTEVPVAGCRGPAEWISMLGFGRSVCRLIRVPFFDIELVSFWGLQKGMTGAGEDCTPRWRRLNTTNGVQCGSDTKMSLDADRPGTGPLTERPDRHPCRGNIRAGLVFALLAWALFALAGVLS